MNKVVWAAAIAATLILTGLHGAALAQTTPVKEPAKETAPASPVPAVTETDDAKAKAAAERKAKRAEERKAKRAEKKAKREEARKERMAKREEAKKERSEHRTSRRKQCGTEWREARKAGTVEKDMTWPKFWSACNTRLKAQAEKAKTN